MFELPKPDVILVHESDLDGFVSGLLLRRLAQSLFHEEVRLEAWHTHAWQQRPLSENSAWVADLAFDRRMDRPGWVVIDHHPALAEPRHARLVHDTTKSAGRLCHELCREHGVADVSDATARIVELSNVADLFLCDHPDFEAAQDHASLVKTYHFWNLYDLIGGELESLLDHPLIEVMRTRRRVEDPIGLAWSRERIEMLTEEVAYVPVVVGNSNQIVHEILRDAATPARVLLTLSRKPGGQITASLRSRNGEALTTAERLQGGGHPDAAGATLPRTVRGIPDALDYLRRTLTPKSKVPTRMTGLAGLLETFDAGLK